MLSQLKVQNFAIIDNLIVNFNEGFTTLTGETGAGKSLIIDAIGLLFGDRSSSMMIRTGETKATVEGIFENISKYTKQVIDNLQIELLDRDIVVIKREISTTGKNLIRVNGEIITLTQLELLASTLGDIHTQDETHKLFDQHNYLTFIDDEKVASLLAEYTTLRKNYLSLYKAYQSVLELSRNDNSNLEFWEYQYKELEKANLSVNEVSNLEAELSYLNNFEHIYNNMSGIKQEFNDNNILEHLYEVINYLDKLRKYQPEFDKDYEKLNDYYYELEDFDSKLNNKLINLDYDETRLNEINERLSYLNTLKNKYNRSIKELINFKSELKEKIESFEQIDDKIANAKDELQKAFLLLKAKALEITNERVSAAKVLEESVLSTLHDLMLSKVQFKIVFDKYDLNDALNTQAFKPNGCDAVDILISFNVGEQLKPLSKVASGGEMSRIMLALKVHILKKLKLSTVIFDEIDSGVSGNVAGKVGEKLKEISKNVQVLAITHLPIVACLADHQYKIYKEYTETNTSTRVKELTGEERILEVAEMISPNDVTAKSKELAKLMLENNK